MPAAISIVPVVAVGLLALYRHLLIRHGPYGALVASTVLCAGGLFTTSMGALSGIAGVEWVSVWALYIFRCVAGVCVACMDHVHDAWACMPPRARAAARVVGREIVWG